MTQNKNFHAQPSSYPTTSDISMFMRDLGYEWSNQAQIYFNQSGARFTHLTREAGERLYKKLVGNKPYSTFTDKTVIATALGKLGGSAKTEKKIRASRLNGIKGGYPKGRPRK